HFMAAISNLQQAICRDRTGIPRTHLARLAIENNRERTHKRQKDLFMGESMRITCHSRIDFKIPGTQFGRATLRRSQPREMKAIKVKVRSLRGTDDRHTIVSCSKLTKSSSYDIVN